MTRSEVKIQWMMEQCKVGRKTAIAYLDGAEWSYSHALEDFRADSAAVHAGKLEWKRNPKD